MLDEVLRHITDLADGAPVPPADTSTVTVALIGTAGLVLSAIIAGYFGTRGERAARGRAQISEAEYDAAHAENARRDAETKVDDLEAQLRARDRFLYRRRFDPARVVRGDETDDEAKF